jgi:hypothetical protein
MNERGMSRRASDQSLMSEGEATLFRVDSQARGTVVHREPLEELLDAMDPEEAP